ncbi:hypothetical protein [Hymenobacter rubripertinctus]|uniref:Uncharacterized protein n=1 Tax=Hymenobacter rubripertinctus TaxID=2029981 RepID=A0A418R6L4_9BACT|nr:hypothetical protein [Hymenobacter rubripertinctus]RIY12931.1 hypothetical protein D0T11_04175 [Hymenobacter rubripertinctus]
MKTLYPYLLALTLFVLLLVGAQVSQAQPAAVSPESVAVRSTRLARYLARSLNLSRRQHKEVARSTRTYLAQLASLGETNERPGLVAAAEPGRLLPSPAALRAEKNYEEELARVLTPGQYNGYRWLRRQPGAAR